MGIMTIIGRLRGYLREKMRDESGATAVEYAVILAAVAGAIIAAGVTWGDDIIAAIDAIIDEL
ncbi:Flp pilus assembly pilin Flp [Rhodovulum bhavnagarense]|uniref:Flp pilus assembly pilin Flp n=1 Tax=Rhodovulum bhavnagarense TaxID=992286 RepID=A0A4R2RC27_9RHOB|nr:DUF4244 domain-containing protein [Rhodovulum bhavnagarense]TCP60912.1 Flp pilus assembly pilin Flp [Rhodovulum bhavnagarense]